MDILLKKTLAFAETNRKKNKVKPMQYQYPIHINNPRIARVAFEVQHKPALLHPRPETAYRRASTAFTIKTAKTAFTVNLRHKIQTVDELSIKKPKTISNITSVLLRRAKNIKVNTSRVIQMPRVIQIPRIIITKPTSAQ